MFIRMETVDSNIYQLFMEQILISKDYYPDYIVQLNDDTIWLIETKGGEK